jgi:type 1 glutamine amidotransferase
MLQRRELLQTLAATAISAFPIGWTAAHTRRAKSILFFTRSQGFQHSVVNRQEAGKGGRKGTPGELAHAEQIVTDLGKQHGFDVVCTKDGRIFVPEELARFDAVFFYTTGDLTNPQSADNTPPMPKDGKKVLLDFIASGKGFVGSHCATDTFHSPGKRDANQTEEQIDPYIRMIGGEFIVHGEQFKATMKVTSTALPGHKGLADFDLHEEWYALKNFAPDLHVILAQDSSAATQMWRQDKNPRRVQANAAHIRPLHPATWARKHDKGRVFYTSMGHREDVWTNDTFQKVLLGGLAWALGNVDADLTPNISAVTPEAAVLRSPIS